MHVIQRSIKDGDDFGLVEIPGAVESPRFPLSVIGMNKLTVYTEICLFHSQSPFAELARWKLEVPPSPDGSINRSACHYVWHTILPRIYVLITYLGIVAVLDVVSKKDCHLITTMPLDPHTLSLQMVDQIPLGFRQMESFSSSSYQYPLNTRWFELDCSPSGNFLVFKEGFGPQLGVLDLDTNLADEERLEVFDEKYHMPLFVDGSHKDLVWIHDRQSQDPADDLQVLCIYDLKKKEMIQKYAVQQSVDYLYALDEMFVLVRTFARHSTLSFLFQKTGLEYIVKGKIDGKLVHFSAIKRTLYFRSNHEFIVVQLPTLWEDMAQVSLGDLVTSYILPQSTRNALFVLPYFNSVTTSVLSFYRNGSLEIWSLPPNGNPEIASSLEGLHGSFVEEWQEEDVKYSYSHDDRHIYLKMWKPWLVIIV